MAYSDINKDFGLKDSAVVITGADAIAANIQLILTTQKKTRVFRRGICTYLMDLLFAPVSDSTALSVRTELITVLQLYEPRIKATLVQVLPIYDESAYYVSIEYEILAEASRAVSLTFNLSSGVR